MIGDPRYAPVTATLPATLPPVTREEAERAARRLYRAFLKADTLGAGGRVVKFGGKVRRCWISSKQTSGHYKGWGRLVHDVSHRVFEWRYPQLKPHHGLHARLEAEMAQYVVAQGWLDGKLRPPVKPAPDAAQKRALKLARTEAAIERWQSKQRRAENALKKLKRRRSALLREAVGAEMRS